MTIPIVSLQTRVYSPFAWNFHLNAISIRFPKSCAKNPKLKNPTKSGLLAEIHVFFYMKATWISLDIPKSSKIQEQYDLGLWYAIVAGSDYT